MEQTKNFLLSKTLWGVVIMIAAKAFPKVFSGIDADGLADNLILACGAILTVIGRITAKTDLTIGSST